MCIPRKNFRHGMHLKPATEMLLINAGSGFWRYFINASRCVDQHLVKALNYGSEGHTESFCEGHGGIKIPSVPCHGLFDGVRQPRNCKGEVVSSVHL